MLAGAVGTGQKGGVAKILGDLWGAWGGCSTGLEEEKPVASVNAVVPGCGESREVTMNPASAWGPNPKKTSPQPSGEDQIVNLTVHGV